MKNNVPPNPTVPNHTEQELYSSGSSAHSLLPGEGRERTSARPSNFLACDLREAQRFLDSLAGNPGCAFTFQTFDDCKGRKDRTLAKIFQGTLEEHARELEKLNSLGAGVFVTVNETDLKGRSIENIIGLRAVFIDSDTGDLPSSFSLPPSIIVNSGSGQHAYWLLSAGGELDQFTTTQLSLASHFKTDENVKDLTRVMRLPGFLHQKNPKSPKFVSIASIRQDRYRLDEVQRSYPPKLEARGQLSFSSRKFLEEGAPAGIWNTTLFKFGKDSQEQGYSIDETIEMAEQINGYLDEADLATIASAYKKEPKYAPRISKTGISVADLAEDYLSDREHRREVGLCLRYWQGDYYSWTGTHYKLLPTEDITVDITAWLQGRPDLRKRSCSKNVNEILFNLKGSCAIPSSACPPCTLTNSAVHLTNNVSLENGVLDINALISTGTANLSPHSPELFSLTTLPYSFDQSAQCPTWRRVLEEIQPNQEVQNLLQEWAGYNLVADVGQEKFTILFGEGANGKSVYLTVLRILLGEGNFTSVPLEAFNASKTFMLAATAGKLANIVSELNELDKTSEGNVKNYVSGESFTAERKYKDPFTFNPTARLTFSTNTLPRFVDRSDGIWRRMLLVPFQTRILDEAKQDKRLKDISYWKSTGELPGIFNWALEGLIRLRKRSTFLEPEVCRIAKDSYRCDMNPTRVFIMENYLEGSVDDFIPKSEIYEAYTLHLKQMGHHPMSQSQFAHEVKRVFASAEATKQPRLLKGGKRERVWLGLKPINTLQPSARLHIEQGKRDIRSSYPSQKPPTYNKGK